MVGAAVRGNVAGGLRTERSERAGGSQVGRSEPPFESVARYQLALELGCDRAEKTLLQQRYMAYPLSVSPVFRLEAHGPEADALLQQRAYLYRMNTSPGLLAGDELNISVDLKGRSSLYLADQAATKVHRMPQPGTTAQVNYAVRLGANATLEFLPEPLILFEDAALLQTTEIVAEASAGFCWGEIILPGRLARAECYQFRELVSRVRVRNAAGKLLFAETLKLLGKENRFAHSLLFSSAPVMGSLVVWLPAAVASRDSLALLKKEIDAIASHINGNPANVSQANAGQDCAQHSGAVTVASSVLPAEQGVFVRAMAGRSQTIQQCFKEVVNAVRRLKGEAPLPYSV